MAAGSEVNGSLTHLVESEKDSSSSEKTPDHGVEVTEAGEQHAAVASHKVD